MPGSSLAVACERLAEPGKMTVGIFCDTGQRYLSVDGLFGTG